MGIAQRSQLAGRLEDRGIEGDELVLRDRVTHLGGPDNPQGEYVLYWAQSARRLRSNLALDYAIHEANEAGLPVVVYESLRPDYRAANDRNRPLFDV